MVFAFEMTGDPARREQNKVHAATVYDEIRAVAPLASVAAVSCKDKLDTMLMLANCLDSRTPLPPPPTRSQDSVVPAL